MDGHGGQRNQCERFHPHTFLGTDLVQCRHFSGEWLSPIVLFIASCVRPPVFSLDYITSDGPVVNYLLFTWMFLEYSFST